MEGGKNHFALIYMTLGNLKTNDNIIKYFKNNQIVNESRAILIRKSIKNSQITNI